MRLAKNMASNMWLAAHLALSSAIAAVLWMSQVAATQAAEASTRRSISTVIAELVRDGLAANLTLNNQSLEAQKSEDTLRAARARWWPEVSLNSRYTTNNGGRELELPTAQLLNPAYQTLNQLLVSMGQPARFSILPESSFPLLRTHEQDTHFALRQPLYAPGLTAGIRAAEASAAAANLSEKALSHDLRRDITRAYLATQQAAAAAAIIASSVSLLDENLRVNQSLYDNGKLTQDAVLRARAELLTATQQRIDADLGLLQASRALNLLLNRSLDMPIEVAEVGDVSRALLAPPTSLSGSEPLVGKNISVVNALRRRAELQFLQRVEESANAALGGSQARRRPTVALGVDAGIQGERFNTGPRYNYFSGSLLFEWTVFDGGARTAAIDSARRTARQAANQTRQMSERIELEVRTAQDRLLAAADSLAAATARDDAARAAFRIASRKRDEGAATQIEFLDARNALTTAELNLAWTRLDVLERRAEYDHALGSDAETDGAAR